MVFCGMLHSLNKIEESNSDLNTESENTYIQWNSVEAQNSRKISFYFGGTNPWHRTAEPTAQSPISRAASIGAIPTSNWKSLYGTIYKNDIYSLWENISTIHACTLQFDLLGGINTSFISYEGNKTYYDYETNQNRTMHNMHQQNNPLFDQALFLASPHIGSSNVGTLETKNSSEKKGIHIKNIPYSNYELRLYFGNGNSNTINPIRIVEYDVNSINSGIVYDKFCAMPGGDGSWYNYNTDELGGAPGFRGNIYNLSDIDTTEWNGSVVLKDGKTYNNSNYILIQNLTKQNIFICLPDDIYSNIFNSNNAFFNLAGFQIINYSNESRWQWLKSINSWQSLTFRDMATASTVNEYSTHTTTNSEFITHLNNLNNGGSTINYNNTANTTNIDNNQTPNYTPYPYHNLTPLVNPNVEDYNNTNNPNDFRSNFHGLNQGAGSHFIMDFSKNIHISGFRQTGSSLYGLGDNSSYSQMNMKDISFYYFNNSSNSWNEITNVTGSRHFVKPNFTLDSGYGFLNGGALNHPDPTIENDPSYTDRASHLYYDVTRKNLIEGGDYQGLTNLPYQTIDGAFNYTSTWQSIIASKFCFLVNTTWKKSTASTGLQMSHFQIKVDEN